MPGMQMMLLELVGYYGFESSGRTSVLLALGMAIL